MVRKGNDTESSQQICPVTIPLKDVAIWLTITVVVVYLFVYWYNGARHFPDGVSWICLHTTTSMFVLWQTTESPDPAVTLEQDSGGEEEGAGGEELSAEEQRVLQRKLKKLRKKEEKAKLREEGKTVAKAVPERPLPAQQALDYLTWYVSWDQGCCGAGEQYNNNMGRGTEELPGKGDTGFPWIKESWESRP